MESVFASHVIGNPRRRFHPDEQSDNHARFGGAREICSCVLSLDLRDPYYIRFREVETGVDLVRASAAELNRILGKLMKAHYRREMESVARWYACVRAESKRSDVRPRTSELLKLVLEAYEEAAKKRRSAAFVLGALMAIKRDVGSRKGGEEKRRCLRFYDDPANLTGFFGRCVDDAVDEFLDVEVPGADSEEETASESGSSSDRDSSV